MKKLTRAARYLNGMRDGVLTLIPHMRTGDLRLVQRLIERTIVSRAVQDAIARQSAGSKPVRNRRKDP